jgi:hypothetical protein
MAGVTFTLALQSSPSTPIYQATTDLDGSLTFAPVTAGTYLLAEVPPSTSPGATLTGPYPGGAWARVITVTPLSDLRDVLSNNCTCAAATCTQAATCAWDPDTTTASCASTPIDCSGARVGACAATCDPDTGGCDEPVLPAECAPPNDGWIFYIALRDPEGQDASLRCVAHPDAPPVCDPIPTSENRCGQEGATP